MIMLAEPEELLTSLKEHYYAIQRKVNHPTDMSFTLLSPRASSNSMLHLLEQIVSQGSDAPTCQQNVNILSDLFPSLRTLSAASRTIEVRRLIAEYLGEQLARHLEIF